MYKLIVMPLCMQMDAASITNSKKPRAGERVWIYICCRKNQGTFNSGLIVLFDVLFKFFPTDGVIVDEGGDFLLKHNPFTC